MTLPNYFLADLPRDAELSTGMIREACQTLKRNREQYLLRRSTASLVRTLSELAGAWREPEYPFRKLALKADPQETGFTSTTLAKGLDAFFSKLTAEALEALLVQDLGERRRLDDFCASDPEEGQQRAAIARGPELLVHITAGNVPSPALASVVLGLLIRSAQFVKCATGATLLPRLFAHSLYEVEPKLASCLEIATWPGGRASLEAALYSEAECVTATGTDETLADIQQQLPSSVRFLGYGHRVSFGFITKEVLSGFNVARLISKVATDAVAWNQLGCLSPHLFYVERGGRVSPENFAESLATELGRREQDDPRGWIPDRESAAIASRRGFYEVRAAHSPDTRQWCSPDSTAWTVVYEADPRFQLSCLNRFVYVKAITNLDEALAGADAVRGRVSTIGLGATDDRAHELARTCAAWGATRICPVGEMQNPPLSWRHDGRPALADLVTWTDWEHGS